MRAEISYTLLFEGVVLVVGWRCDWGQRCHRDEIEGGGAWLVHERERGAWINSALGVAPRARRGRRGGSALFSLHSGKAIEMKMLLSSHLKLDSAEGSGRELFSDGSHLTVSHRF